MISFAPVTVGSLAKRGLMLQTRRGRAVITGLGKKAIGDVRLCIGCGCTDLRACPEGCSWASTDVCSACVP